jgi:PAS domain S-box-containing protein
MERIAGVGGWERDLVTGEDIWTDGLYLILGRKREELRPSATNFFAAIHQDDRSRLQGLLAGAVKGSGPLETEYRILRPAGDERTANSQVEVLRDKSGAALRIIGAVADVTEKQVAQAEIERQREVIYHREKLGALGSLLAGVAHELNNPLSIVVAQASLLEEEAEDATSIQRAAKIRAAAERCARIVKTFLAMARQRPPSRVAVDMSEAAESALDLLAYGLRSAGVELHRELAPSLPKIWADPDQISQVLTNLIVNAQQALAEWAGPRRLTIATCWDERSQMVQLSVIDSGPGVPVAIKSRIFEPFFTTKPVGVGTGIGLSVCHSIITSHGGTLAVEDTPEGGTTFVVRLPLGTGAEPAAAASKDRPTSGSGKGVLIVDDEPEVAQTLADILGTAGYRIDIADSGVAALERLRSNDYSAVLSDIRMPNMDGMELYRRLKEMRPELAARLILVTGDALSPAVLEFLDESGQPHLEKPFSPAEVRRLVASRADGVKN